MPISWQSVVGPFDSLARELRWSGEDFGKLRRRYRAGKKTQVSVYGSDLDDSQTIEVGLAAVNLATSTERETDAVYLWIYGLQTTVGRYAKPKPPFYYPRIAIASDHETQRLVEAVRALMTDREPEAVVSVLTQADARLLRGIWSRRGQPRFRRELLRLYEGKCAVTGCTTIAALEAAHIAPYADDQHYDTQRGLLLRADVHTLFDLAIISIEPTTRTVVVNPDARDHYGHLQGKSVASPVEMSAQPSQTDLEAHFNRWSQNVDPEANGLRTYP